MDNTAQAARSLRRTGKNDLCDSILERASTRWLKNAEILDLLTHYAEWDLGISTSPPHLPESKIIAAFCYILFQYLIRH